MATQRRIIIGDVHGHYDTLIDLLESVEPTSEDQIYFLGDLIDRGPKSAEVVDLVIKHKYHCLRGNHEEMLLDVVSKGKVSAQLYQGWLYSGGYATVTSYDSKIPQEHIDWMRNLPLYMDLGDIWLVHAGISPHIPLTQQTAEQFCWIREDFHAITQPYFPDKLIITGHTITFTFPGIQPGQLASGHGWLDIETGAYHQNSGWLTALDIDNQKVYQANTQDRRLRMMPLTRAVTEVHLAHVRYRKMPRRA